MYLTEWVCIFPIAELRVGIVFENCFIHRRNLAMTHCSHRSETKNYEFYQDNRPSLQLNLIVHRFIIGLHWIYHRLLVAIRWQEERTACDNENSKNRKTNTGGNYRQLRK